MTRQILLTVATLLVSALVFLLTDGADLNARIVAADVAFLICCWALHLVSEGMAAMLFFLVLGVTRAAPNAVIFSGFTTPSFWLIFSGLLIGTALHESGLSNRLAALVSPKRSKSYPLLLARLCAGGLIFAFFVPSAIGRVVILIPLMMDVARNCGFHEGRKGFYGVVLAGVLSTSLPAYAILPANLSGIVFAGAAKSILGADIGYMDYLLRYFPVLGLLKTVLVWAVLCLFFPDDMELPERQPRRIPWTGREIGSLVVLALALVGWMTDSWHGIAPGWISMIAAVIFLAPVRGWFDAATLFRGVGLNSLLFVAGAIALGNLISVSHLGPFLADKLLAALHLNPAGGYGNVTKLVGVFMGTGVVTTLPGIPSVYVPLAKGIAQAAHMPLAAFLDLVVVAFSTVLFPYQVPPMVIASHASGLPYKNLLITCLTVAVGSIILLVPLSILWLHILGVTF